MLAATNRPELLDPALRRPGRFDREVPVELPDLTGRMEILNHYLGKVKSEENIDVNEVARLAALLLRRRAAQYRQRGRPAGPAPGPGEGEPGRPGGEH